MSRNQEVVSPNHGACSFKSCPDNAIVAICIGLEREDVNRGQQLLHALGKDGRPALAAP